VPLLIRMPQDALAPPNSPELAGIRLRILFRQSVYWKSGAILAALSLPCKIPFPGNRDLVRQRPVRLCRLSRAPQRFVLFGPFCREINGPPCCSHAVLYDEGASVSSIDQDGGKRRGGMATLNGAYFALGPEHAATNFPRQAGL
jgi:hypothetical protein